MIERLPLVAWPPRSVLPILIYHRVLAHASDLFPEEMDGERFRRQMCYLARNFTVMPLREAVRNLRQDTLPHRACCVTFDDGYADNLTVALPILEKYALPATIFIATGYIDGGLMFNDAVIEIVTHTASSKLDLRHIGLELYDIGTIESRRACTVSILKGTRSLPPEVRNDMVKEMTMIAGIDSLPSDLMLNRGQLEELSRHGVEIGGHTVSHPVLSSLADHQAQAEIARGKQVLEGWIGKPVRCFAYPVGIPGRDFTAHHATMVRDLGFDLAVTTTNGVANCQSDPFQLPRFLPWGSSMTKLGARMVSKAWGAAI